jgi:hypothetical protein
MNSKLIVKIVKDFACFIKWAFLLVMDVKYGKPINHHLREQHEYNENNAAKLNDILKGI